MCSKRDIVIFLAGAQTFHTITHILLNFSGILPIQFFSILITPQLNMYAIIINALVTGALLWWAQQLSR